MGLHCSSAPDPTITDMYEIEVKKMSGETIKLREYEGKVLLIVNTASKCGFTKQFAGLEALYKKYKDQGFEILGFPSNDFLSQDPGTNGEIMQFCQVNYGVTFTMFEKVIVGGKEQHPLYSLLTNEKTNPKFSGRISWNFNKFLIGKDGTILNRFGSRTSPDDKELENAIAAALK
jgi:glutathione peroxidase